MIVNSRYKLNLNTKTDNTTSQYNKQRINKTINKTNYNNQKHQIILKKTFINLSNNKNYKRKKGKSYYNCNIKNNYKDRKRNYRKNRSLNNSNMLRKCKRRD